MLMELDPDSSEFPIEYAVSEAWRWQEYDSSLHPPERETLIHYLYSVVGQGTLAKDGWRSGEFEIVNQSWNDPEEKKSEVDQNSFYRYQDDNLGSLTVCLLPVLNDRSAEIPGVDLEVLMAAGKDQLIPNWWSQDLCFTCTVE